MDSNTHLYQRANPTLTANLVTSSLWFRQRSECVHVLLVHLVFNVAFVLQLCVLNVLAIFNVVEF